MRVSGTPGASLRRLLMVASAVLASLLPMLAAAQAAAGSQLVGFDRRERMKLYIVTVRRESQRYVDSIWVDEENAQDREKQLLASLDRAGLGTGTGWNVRLTEGTLADGKKAE